MAIEPLRLKNEAIAATGLSEFGDAPMDEGLERFCWSLSHEASQDPRVQATGEALIRDTLIERLKLEDFLARNLSIADEEIVRPLFVISLPRSGSTATSQFLSEDPNARSIRRWECMNALPPPDLAVGDNDPRIAAQQAAYDRMYREQPERRGMLPVDATDPSEHGPILGLTFQNLQLPSLYNIPTYRDWMIESDLQPAYAYLRRVLQLLQWKTPAAHWNLKNPPDIFGLDALVAVFPDARLVWTHRDPVKCVPSASSLTAMIRISMGEDLDRTTVGPQQAGFHGRGLRMAMAAAERMAEGRIVHIRQRDLIRDTVGQIERIYQDVGLEFTDAFRSQLTRRVAARERPSHAYRMEDYGLTAAGLRTEFRDYTDRFDVPLEG